MRALFFSVILVMHQAVAAADWPQFRGPGGMGTAEARLPETWSETENVLWKIPLPGRGSSSPVVIGNKIFLTASEGGADDVKRQVMCIALQDGKVIWDKTVESVVPEQGKMREDHGYASSTPAATSTHLFVFFGKSGVFCFDHSGKQIWNTRVGSGLHEWGSGSSVVLHGKSVLVNASVESGSLVALDQTSGKELWKAGGITESWHTPALAPRAGGATEVIVAIPQEVRAFDAASGKPLWQCKSGINHYMCPMPLVSDGIVYSLGGRGGVGGVAIRTGGSGEVTQTHQLWTLQKATNVPTPVIHEGHLYFANDFSGVVHCVNVKTGKYDYSERLVPHPDEIFASPVMAGGKILYLGRGGAAIFISASPKFRILSTAELENRRGMFNATPVIAGNKLLLRSNKFLYCIGTAGEN